MSEWTNAKEKQSVRPGPASDSLLGLGADDLELSSFTKENWTEYLPLSPANPPHWSLIICNNHVASKVTGAFCSLLVVGLEWPFWCLFYFLPEPQWGLASNFLPCLVVWTFWMGSYSCLTLAPDDFAISWFWWNENASYSHRTAQSPLMGADFGSVVVW